jgi:hypothetical protein
MIARGLTPLERRAAAVQILLDEWKDRPFSWSERATCARMVAEHLRRMGYRPPLAKAGNYKTALGARRALERLGVASLGEALDAMKLERIAPAAALVGDVVEIPGEPPFGCLTIAAGNGRAIGFHEEAEGVAVMQPVEFIAAWRVEPI